MLLFLLFVSRCSSSCHPFSFLHVETFQCLFTNAIRWMKTASQHLHAKISLNDPSTWEISTVWKETFEKQWVTARSFLIQIFNHWQTRPLATSFRHSNCCHYLQVLSNFSMRYLFILFYSYYYYYYFLSNLLVSWLSYICLNNKLILCLLSLRYKFIYCHICFFIQLISIKITLDIYLFQNAYAINQTKQ